MSENARGHARDHAPWNGSNLVDSCDAFLSVYRGDGCYYSLKVCLNL